LPEASLKLQYLAILDVGLSPQIELAIESDWGPDILMMPIPPLPGGVATAAIVSFLSIMVDR
jgi:hypothetical protein